MSDRRSGRKEAERDERGVREEGNLGGQERELGRKETERDKRGGQGGREL